MAPPPPPPPPAGASPVEVVHAIYDAMAARDLGRLFELLHPEVVITQDERLPWGGRYVGHDGYAQFGLKLLGTIESAVTTDAVFEADGEVLQVGRTRGRVLANEATFDIAEVHRWTIRDGLAVSAHYAIDTPAMLEALAR